MTAPLQPPMLHYAIYTNYGRFDALFDRRIDMSQKMPEWIEARQYDPGVDKTYWDTCLRPVWIRTKRINMIKFVEYIKPPKGEGFKP